jgi:hypothetical protein
MVLFRSRNVKQITINVLGGDDGLFVTTNNTYLMTIK